MSESWYPIYSIKFTKSQMRFLIEHLQELKCGIYPMSHTSSGYDVSIPPGRKEKRYREPAQNRVLELAAEVECRLDLVINYISGWPRQNKKLVKHGNYWLFKKT